MAINGFRWVVESHFEIQLDVHRVLGDAVGRLSSS